MEVFPFTVAGMKCNAVLGGYTVACCCCFRLGVLEPDDAASLAGWFPDVLSETGAELKGKPELRGT